MTGLDVAAELGVLQSVHGLELLGFAAWAGPLVGWLTVLPRPTVTDGRLIRRTHQAGTGLLLLTGVLATVLAFRAADGLVGACGLVRLGLLLGSSLLLSDLLRPPVGAVRRGLGLALIGAVAVSLVLPSAVVQRADWPLPTWAAGVSVLGLAGWAGALLVAAAPAVGGRSLPRVRVLATLSAVVAGLGAVAGLVAALGRPGSGSVVAALVLVGIAGTVGCGLIGLRRRPGWLAAGLGVAAGVLLLGSWPV